jgi:hypothetical protein
MVLPAWAMTISVERLSVRHLQRAVATAEVTDGRGAVDAGFLDRVVPEVEVLDAAVRRRVDPLLDRVAAAVVRAGISADAVTLTGAVIGLAACVAIALRADGLAWTFAMLHGAMTTRLAILNVPHPLAMLRGMRTGRQLRKSWYIFFFQLPRLPEWAITRSDFAFIRHTFAGDGVPDADIARYVDALRQPGAVQSAVNYYRATIRRSVAGRMAAITPITVPVPGR